MHPHLSIRCFCQSKLQCRIIKKNTFTLPNPWLRQWARTTTHSHSRWETDRYWCCLLLLVCGRHCQPARLPACLPAQLLLVCGHPKAPTTRDNFVGNSCDCFVGQGWCHTVTLSNTLSGRSRGKLTVEGQTGGQSEAHIDILPCNSFQHSARHTLFIRRCSDLIRGGCAPLSRCHRMRRARSATPPIIRSGCQLNGSESLCTSCKALYKCDRSPLNLSGHLPSAPECEPLNEWQCDTSPTDLEHPHARRPVVIEAY